MAWASVDSTTSDGKWKLTLNASAGSETLGCHTQALQGASIHAMATRKEGYEALTPPTPAYVQGGDPYYGRKFTPEYVKAYTEWDKENNRRYLLFKESYGDLVISKEDLHKLLSRFDEGLAGKPALLLSDRLPFAYMRDGTVVYKAASFMNYGGKGPSVRIPATGILGCWLMKYGKGTCTMSHAVHNPNHKTDKDFSVTRVWIYSPHNQTRNVIKEDRPMVRYSPYANAVDDWKKEIDARYFSSLDTVNKLFSNKDLENS